MTWFVEKWKQFFRRKPLRVHLGQVAVAPRTDILRHFEGALVGITDEVELRAYVLELLNLPNAPDQNSAQDTDLAVDVIITRYRLGEFMWGDPIPFVGWRPMIEIASRTYYVKSGRVFATIGVNHKMPWREYFNRMLKLRIVTPFSSREDMQFLLATALGKLLFQLKSRT